jgi:tetratricopeptide (TPR) repeat protein
MNDKESETRALDYANRAIQIDPNYAPAYALRASIMLDSSGMLWMDPLEAAGKARRDTERAIALDPNLAGGYQVLSRIQSEVKLNCREAEIPLEKARELVPRDPDNLGRSGMLAMCQGRQEEAVELLKQELVLDPLRPSEYMYLAQDLRDLGRYEQAHAALGKALDLNPNQIMAYEVRGEVYLAQGRPQEALAEMEKEPAGFTRDLGKALAYHALGRGQESDAALAHLISQYQDTGAYQIAQVYGYRGEVDQAFAWLNRAYKQRDPGLLWFKTDLKLRSLRKDPRYAQLLRKLNLPE